MCLCTPCETPLEKPFAQNSHQPYNTEVQQVYQDHTSSILYGSSDSLAFFGAVNEAHLVTEPGHTSAADGNAAFQCILGGLLGAQLVPNGGQ